MFPPVPESDVNDFAPTTAAATLLLAAVITTTACAPPPAPAAGPLPPSIVTGETPAAATSAPEVREAGDIPDNQVFVPYSPADGRYTLSVPEGWSRTADGGAVVFTDTFNSVRVEIVPRPGGAPDVSSARAQELPTITAATPGVHVGDVTAVRRQGGQAVLITYTGQSPPDPVTGKSVATAVERYEFWQAGQEAVLTLSGARGADNVDPWRTVSDSFRWRP